MKLSSSFSLFATSLLIGISNWANAIDASPMPIKDMQPNGDWVTLKIKGDEYFNWQEDGYGYTVIKHQGWYKYAKVDEQGHLQPTNHIVGQVDPTQLKLAPGLLPNNNDGTEVKGSSQKPLGSDGTIGEQADTLTGVRPHLVVLIRFADHQQKTLPSVEQIDTLFNGLKRDEQLIPSGSVKQLFEQNSYGQLKINSTILQWIDLPHPQAYYSQNGGTRNRLEQGIQSALSQLESTVDFKQFDSNKDGYLDGVTFLHSGYGAEWGGTDSDRSYYKDRIWSHQRSFTTQLWVSQQGIQIKDYAIASALWGVKGNDITRIGVIAHEMGHQLGLPDLYGSIDNPQVIDFDFMANAWDFETSQHCPGQLSLWSKIQLGWYNPKVIAEDGQYQLRAINSYPDGYLLGNIANDDGFYWLVENRQANGFDCSMKQSGLLVWQVNSVTPYVDRRGIIRTEQMSLVSVKAAKEPNEQAQKYGDFSVILDEQIAVKEIVKNDGLISFCLNQCMSAPTNLRVNVKRMLRQGFSVELSWVDNAHNETQIIIERCRVVFKDNQKHCQFKPHANVAANATRYKDKVNFGQYLYRIKAVNENSSSSYSKPAST